MSNTSTSSNGSSSSTSEGSTSRLYAMHDQWHVTSVATATGTVVERYAYEAFGTSFVLSPSFALQSASLFGWETRFGAYKFDEEIGLYCVRFRYLHPGLGRWISRDPFGESPFLLLIQHLVVMKREMPPQSLHPQYDYASNAPSTSIDATGLWTLREDSFRDEPTVTWTPPPCAGDPEKGIQTKFIQVVHRTRVWGIICDPFIDNSGSRSPFYKLPPHLPGSFQDTPGSIAQWDTVFELCKACVCSRSQKVISLGPCVHWYVGGIGFRGAEEYDGIDFGNNYNSIKRGPSPEFMNLTNKCYPGFYTPFRTTPPPLRP